MSTACLLWTARGRARPGEIAGMADTERSGASATLRHMESRDRRYDWAADDPRWTDEPASSSHWGSNGNGRLDLDPPPPLGAEPDHSWDDLLSSKRPLAITGPTPQTTAPQLPVQPGYGLLAQVARWQDSRLSTVSRTRAERRQRPDARVRRRRRSTDDEFRRTSLADIFGAEPRYGAVFGLTAAWYALLAVIFLGWLVIAGGQGSGARPVLASLPWVATAVLLSLAVAALLRWAVVGWRALTLSFAAAIIGAGVVTVAHSLAV
jgi:hypothetical protein